MVQVSDGSVAGQPPHTYADAGAGHSASPMGTSQWGHQAGPPPAPAPAPPQPDRFTRLVDRLWTRPAWVAPLAILVCFTGASALLLSNDPTDGRPDTFGGCAVKLLTGFDCPGCGGTRALWYLVHGNLPEAARHHAFAVFAAPFLVYMYIAWAGQRIFGWRIPQLTITPKAIGGFLIAWGVFMVLRNLPWAPFTLFYV